MLSTYEKEREIRNALIRRWNKYHPINREVARHIRALEQQGEDIWGSWWEPMDMLNVLSLCWWAVQHPDIETRWWSDDGDGGTVGLEINSDYIYEIHEGWHPKTVMDFFKYRHDRNSLTDEPTHVLKYLRKTTDPIDASHILIHEFSTNLSAYLYNHFISDNADDS